MKYGRLAESLILQKMILNLLLITRQDMRPFAIILTPRASLIMIPTLVNLLVQRLQTEIAGAISS